MRGLRFGTQTGGAPSGQEWAARARRLEALGFATLSIPDHVAGAAWSPFPALAAAAAATTTLRVGTLTLDNDFRNPLLVAREAATVDVVSDGRLELGIGAGWYDRDNASLGLPFDRGRVRVDRLAEAVTLLKRFFAEDEVSFEGRFYRHDRAQCRPAPVQRPHPPILIAGGGPRILELAGREADIVALIPMVGSDDHEEYSFEGARRKVDRVRAAAGERFKRIELTVFLDVVLTDDRERAIAAIARERDVPESRLRSSLYRPIGSLDDVRAHILRAREELGITYFTIRGPHVDACGPLVRELSGT